MDRRKYIVLLGISWSIGLFAMGCSLSPTSWGKPVGSFLLLIGTGMGFLTIGYQWGSKKGGSNG